MSDQEKSKKLFSDAMQHAEEGDLGRALELYDKVTDLEPLLMEAWFNKAIIYEGLWQRDEAIQCYLKVMDINPTNVDASRSLGIHYFHKKQLSRARYWLEKVVRFGEHQSKITIGDSHVELNLNLKEMHRQCLEELDCPHDLFIGHASENKPDIQDKLLPALRNAGYEFFIDMSRIPQSLEWNPTLRWQIEQGIGQCDALVLVWSIYSSKSPFVGSEIQAAVGMIKNIVLLTLDDTPLPPAIQSALKIGRIGCVYIHKGARYRDVINILSRQRSLAHKVMTENRKRKTYKTHYAGVQFEWIRLNGGVLADFSVAKYPVTQEQWEAVMGANPAFYKGDNTRPVESVSWNDVQHFIATINKKARPRKKVRLLNGFEWEYACRAESLGNWCFGDNENLLHEYAWFMDNAGIGSVPGYALFGVGGINAKDSTSFDRKRARQGPIQIETSPHHTNSVYTKKPNGWGIFHMHGNVSEWCDEDVLGKPGYKRIRGGAYNNAPRNLRCSAAGAYPADKGDKDIGFRLCISHK